MFNRYAAVAALSTVAVLAIDPRVGVAAPAPGASTAAFQTITRDGVSISYQRVSTPGTPRSGAGETRADYDGDGLDDIAATARGGVVVRYSSQRWTDYFGTVGGGSMLRLGTALASGDFNNDGYDDLAMGDPGETDPVTDTASGGLWIVPGSAQGLRTAGIRHLNQSSAGVPDTSTAGDEFAGSLAAGDITGDGRADLAVGVPGKDLGAANSAGALVTLLGAATGITTTGARWLNQNSPLMPDTAESWDRFGDVLAIGRFDDGPHGDLAVGSTGESDPLAQAPSKGLLNLILGSPTGLNVRSVPSVYGTDVEAATPGVTITRLGYGGLAVADTDGDGRMDLAAGAPEATVDGHVGAGAVVTVRGGTGGLDDATSVAITQNTAGIPGDAEDRDGFGASVAAGDVSGDGIGDLIVGVPYEDVVDAPTAPPGTIADAGVITLLRGSRTGPTGGRAGELSQGYEYTPGTSETGDRFGHDVTVLDLDGRDGLDAAVSAPGERGVDQGSGQPAPTGDTPGSVTTYSGGDPNFMYGVRRTTGRDVQLPGIDTNIYGYVL